MHSLPIFVRLKGRNVILVGTGEAANAKRRLLERAEANVVEENEDSSLAIVALEEGAEEATARLRARGILVNTVDRPDLCDFTLPAIVDRDPVVVAIGTGGASAGLAKALRQRLEAILPVTLGQLAKRFAATRSEMRAKWPSAAERRRAIDAALSEDGALDPMRDGSVNGFDDWITGTSEASPGDLTRITLASDDPDNLTLRQARCLAQADAVYHTAQVHPAILHRARADATRIACDAAPDGPFEGLVLFLERT